MTDCENCKGTGKVLKEWTDDEFEDYLNEIYSEEVSVCGYMHQQGTLLKEIDPIAFNCAMSDTEEEEDCPDCEGTGEVEE